MAKITPSGIWGQIQLDPLPKKYSCMRFSQNDQLEESHRCFLLIEKQESVLTGEQLTLLEAKFYHNWETKTSVQESRRRKLGTSFT